MGDSFSKKLGNLLSDVLETGEIPHKQEFSANESASASGDFSASDDVFASTDSSSSANFSANNDVSASTDSSAGANSSPNSDASAGTDSSAGANSSPNSDASAGAGFSASTSARKRRTQFNFSQKKSRVAQIIRQGSYTEIPQEVVAAFALLGCPVTSTPAEVRRTFRTKIKKLHPDSASQNSENATAESEKLISANETIKNWFIQKGI